MKEFVFEVVVHGVRIIESSRCPSQWKGSGCYDVEIPEYRDAKVTIAAETLESAMKLLDGITFQWDDIYTDEYELESWDCEESSEEEVEDVLSIDYN